MATSKSKRMERERRKRQKRKSYSDRVHTVTRGKVRYDHLGADINGEFVDPPRITFLIREKACGRCPLSLVCLSSRSWMSLFVQYSFFRCKRCCALGFVDRAVAHKDMHLFVCFLLRNNRVNADWRNTGVQRHDGDRHVERIVAGKDAMAHNRIQLIGDLPFACITRCRDNLGYVTHKKLADEVDCRTTMHNGLKGNVTSY